jgi:hypothetical protein
LAGLLIAFAFAFVIAFAFAFVIAFAFAFAIGFLPDCWFWFANCVGRT